MAAAVTTAAGVLLGPANPLFALITNLVAMAWTATVLHRYRPALAARWFRVRAWEERVWPRLGTGLLSTLLRAVGWNRVIAAQRQFDGTRAGLTDLARHTRASELSHLVVAILSALGGIVAAVCGNLRAALWLWLAAVVFHLHPVLLQRQLRARITRVRSLKSY